MSELKALRPEELCPLCPLDKLTFETTAELETYEGVVGQARAVKALKFGVRMPGEGYNLYVLGRSGAGKHELARNLLMAEASSEEPPGDLCYVNNFSDAQRPIALMLPRGSGKHLKHDMQQLIEDLRVALPAAFDSEEFRNRLAELSGDFEQREKEIFKEVREEAEKENMALLQSPQGFVIAPVHDEKVLGPEEFEQLPDEDKKRIEEITERLQALLKEHIGKLPRLIKERRGRESELVREITRSTVVSLMEELESKYAEFKQVILFFDNVKTDIIENVDSFRPVVADAEEGGSPVVERPLARYEVNVVVDNATLTGAPVVYESNPSLANLLGHVEHVQQLGALVTDFTHVRPGALHRANGGYLVLDADRLLMQPLAWDALKRALQSGEIRIESAGQMMSVISTVTLEPETVPLNVKVALLGNRRLYYLLAEYDESFNELFKVAADFVDELDRNDEHIELYARLIASTIRRRSLRPFDREAVGRIIDHCARLADDSEKLTTHIGSISDLLREADFWAAERTAEVVSVDDVNEAIAQQVYRKDRVRSLILEEIDRNTILIDTKGNVTGQVNGLAVVQYGEMAFGHPTRITATARMGDGEVIDVEREAELGGSIHTKAVMIVASLIGSRYAAEVPLSLSATLVFEQSYSGVEGDSASVAEICALLSALCGVPLRQNFAVTGSVNQHGRVQAVGGVNEKIEGFFDVCKARGLTGDQGVLLPADNVKHLTLRSDVVDAVRDGRFHIFPIATIDEAITALTGMEAGTAAENGKFPSGTFNALVAKRLKRLAMKRQAFGDKDKKKKKKQPTHETTDADGSDDMKDSGESDSDEAGTEQ